MRILICGINYFPEIVGIGKFTGEMARYLALRGHEVRMVTAPPYYPEWRVQAGYSAWEYRHEVIESVQVYRAPLWVPAQPTGLTRILHLLSFALFSAPALWVQRSWKPEVLLSIAPAITSAPFAWFTARRIGCPAWLHIQDFELDAALKLQMVPGLHLLGRLFERSESQVLKRFDRVSTISDRMLERLRSKGVDPQKACLLPNWVDCQTIFPQNAPNPLRESLVVRPDQILILHAGSMGQKQGLELLIQAARLLHDENRLQFVFCGQGSARAGLVEQAVDLNNVTFIPLQPVGRLNDLLNAADIHVLIQRGDAADLVMPSRLNGMLASGRPVIATASPGTELARVVSQIGMVIPPGDVAGLCTAILQLANQTELRKMLGEKGRNYALEHLDQAIILERLIEELKCVIQAHLT